ncbi:MAG: hypothetical protein AB4352_28165 [Hormoscilla sp.]
MKKMKKFKVWGTLALLFIAGVAVSFSIFTAQPSNAIIARNQNMIDLGLIDGILTPEEMGLEYLGEATEPIEISRGLIDTLRRVPEELAVDFEGNEPLGVDLGTAFPIQFGVLPDGGQLASSEFTGIAYIDNSGQPQPITPDDIGEMAAQEAAKGGLFTDGTLIEDAKNEGLIAFKVKAEHSLVADASGMLIGQRRVPVVSLIVHNRSNKHNYLVNKVNVNALCRDAVNGAVRHRLRRINTFRVTRPQRRINDPRLR